MTTASPAEPTGEAPALYLIGLDERLTQLLASLRIQTMSFRSANDFLAVPSSDRPGCVICDVMVSVETSGFQLLRLLREKSSCLPVILVSKVADMSLALRAVNEGAVTMLHAECDAQSALEAVDKALQLNRDKRAHHAMRRRILALIATLNERESNVLKMVTNGLANKQIAAELNVSLRSVEKWRKDALEKLNIDSPLQLLRSLMQAGFQAWPE